MAPEPSRRLYSAVTKHWPKVASALVVTLGIVELVAGGLTADSGIEFYLMAWAGTTGGLWFLFEKGEQALSEEARSNIASRLVRIDIRGNLEAVPVQYVALMGTVFGDRALSWRFLGLSCVASITSALIVGGLLLAADPTAVGAEVSWGLALGVVLAVNTLPDFVSLVETRAMVRWAASPPGTALENVPGELSTAFASLVRHAKGNQRLVMAVSVDFVATSMISATFWGAAVAQADAEGWGLPNGLVLVGMLSAFFTSVWLWLYVASVLLSRLLVRLDSGIGFLLRVTDVERQPFRSMGFVSVIIVSVLFALGLPFVLL